MYFEWVQYSFNWSGETGRYRHWRFDSVGVRSRIAVPVLIVGAGAGLISAGYLALLHLLTHWIGPATRPIAIQLLILVTAGALIAVIFRFAGDGGSVALLVDNIHVTGGNEDVKDLKSLVPASLICISAGGAMGPEAPLVEIGGTFGSWVASRFNLSAEDMRVLTISGMAAGVSVLFGAPLGAAIFALEILHRKGLQYYEALVPALVGSFIGYMLNIVLGDLGIGPVWHLPDVGPLAHTDLLWGIACGIIGGLAAIGFTYGVGLIRRLFAKVPIGLVPVVAGVMLGALYWWSPFALTNGKLQVASVVDAQLGVAMLATAIVAKAVGVMVTIAGKWKGGFIIPLFFIGIAGGQLIHTLLPTTNAAVLMVGLAVALCVGVTKTPVGSTLVVIGMTGLTLLPMAIAAAVVALVVSSRTTLIESQRAREQVGAKQ